VPDYTGAVDTNARAAIKTTHGMAQKRRNNVVNMNTALIDTFLDLIPVAFRQSYEQIRMENPNSVFGEMFSWFFTKLDARPLKIPPPIATRWASSGTPRKGLSSSLRAYFAGPPS